mmetsp:Transcript_63973/g.128566  ORF Transcript_63973/g.128566 Transcript_63973/m.128566 type:complete len:290 (+) Transcript_63973:422-1291(+)
MSCSVVVVIAAVVVGTAIATIIIVIGTGTNDVVVAGKPFDRSRRGDCWSRSGGLGALPLGRVVDCARKRKRRGGGRAVFGRRRFEVRERQTLVHHPPTHHPQTTAEALLAASVSASVTVVFIIDNWRSYRCRRRCRRRWRRRRRWWQTRGGVRFGCGSCSYLGRPADWRRYSVSVVIGDSGCFLASRHLLPPRGDHNSSSGTPLLRFFGTTVTAAAATVCATVCAQAALNLVPNQRLHFCFQHRRRRCGRGCCGLRLRGRRQMQRRLLRAQPGAVAAVSPVVQRRRWRR